MAGQSHMEIFDSIVSHGKRVGFDLYIAEVLSIPNFHSRRQNSPYAITLPGMGAATWLRALLAYKPRV